MPTERILKTLFCIPNSSACFSFKIFPIEASNSVLRDYIELAGGYCLESDEDGEPYTIPIVDFNWLIANNITEFKKSEGDFRDYFTAGFVYDSYLKDRVFNLNKYKLTRISDDERLSKYDANKILRRQLSWSEVIKNSQTSTINNIASGPSCRSISDPQSLEKEGPSSSQPNFTFDNPSQNTANEVSGRSQSRSQVQSQRPRKKLTQLRTNKKDLRQMYGKIIAMVSPNSSPQSSQNAPRRPADGDSNSPASSSPVPDPDIIINYFKAENAELDNLDLESTLESETGGKQDPGSPSSPANSDGRLKEGGGGDNEPPVFDTSSDVNVTHLSESFHGDEFMEL